MVGGEILSFGVDDGFTMLDAMVSEMESLPVVVDHFFFGLTANSPFN